MSRISFLLIKSIFIICVCANGIVTAQIYSSKGKIQPKNPNIKLQKRSGFEFYEQLFTTGKNEKQLIEKLLPDQALELETHILAGSFYSLKNNLTAILMLNNKGGVPLVVTPTVYSRNGTELQLAPLTVNAASYSEFDLRQLLTGAGEEFQEGSLQVKYQGMPMLLGAQVKLIDEAKSLIWEEQFVEPAAKFVSNRLESVWWLPAGGSETKFIISNTTGAPVRATIKVDGTSPGQQVPVEIQLNPHQTRLLDVIRDLVKKNNGTLHAAGGISVTHSGTPGAVLGKMLISQPNKGFSSTVNLIDPEMTGSQKWYGSGLRLGKINGEKLQQILVARNVGGEMATVSGRIPYTKENGEAAAIINIPPTQIAPNSTKTINLQSFINSANVPASAKYAGIEVEYNSSKGSVVTSALSVSQNNDLVFQVPMYDPLKTPSSAGGYPWKADGDYSTLIYIKNETNQPKKYTAYLNYEGGGYALGVKELKEHQTVAIDFRKLRDEQTPDSMGRIIPLNIDKGQVSWSLSDSENHSLNGRSEQVSLSKGIISSYNCQNCCPNEYYDSWVTPGEVSGGIGDTTDFDNFFREANCYGQIYPFQVVDLPYWESLDWNVASCNFSTGVAAAVGAGNTIIQSSWTGRDWWYESGRCDEILLPITDIAYCDVTDPQPSISDVGWVEKNGLKAVTVSVTGAGYGDTTVFKLRLKSGTGSATFEDGSTEKSYTGNLSNTELKIKGVTESSTANNYVIEPLVNGTTKTNKSKDFTVAVINSLEFERINADDVALDNNPGNGQPNTNEGQRIYPDKNTSGDGTDRATLRVKATVSPASVPNLKVFFASFDLDDPSANASPIDTNGSNGNDNNGNVSNSKSGQFSNPTSGSCSNATTGASPSYISKIECSVSSNTASTNFKVTMQPGDNFAVAASLVGTYRNEIHLNSSAGTNLINNANQIIPKSGEANTNNVQGIRTKMLTVWRRVHIEYDSMGAVSGNNVTGTFPASATYPANSFPTINVTVNPSLVVNSFESGRMVTGGQSFEIFQNSANSISIVNNTSLTITSGQSFTIYDDDDFDTPDDAAALNGDEGDNIPIYNKDFLNDNDTVPTSINTKNTNALAEAYIRPKYDLPNSQEDVPVFVNISADTGAAIRSAFKFDNSTFEADVNFWTIYLLGGYQYVTAEDGDPITETTSNNLTVGVSDAQNGQGSITFLESLAPQNCLGTSIDCSIEATYVHEVGHLFNANHNQGGVMDNQSVVFSETSIKAIRSVTNP